MVISLKVPGTQPRFDQHVGSKTLPTWLWMLEQRWTMRLAPLTWFRVLQRTARPTGSGRPTLPVPACSHLDLSWGTSSHKETLLGPFWAGPKGRSLEVKVMVALLLGKTSGRKGIASPQGCSLTSLRGNSLPGHSRESDFVKARDEFLTEGVGISPHMWVKPSQWRLIRWTTAVCLTPRVSAEGPSLLLETLKRGERVAYWTELFSIVRGYIKESCGW